LKHFLPSCIPISTTDQDFRFVFHLEFTILFLRSAYLRQAQCSRSSQFSQNPELRLSRYRCSSFIQLRLFRCGCMCGQRFFSLFSSSSSYFSFAYSLATHIRPSGHPNRRKEEEAAAAAFKASRRSRHRRCVRRMDGCGTKGFVTIPSRNKFFSLWITSCSCNIISSAIVCAMPVLRHSGS
jgi:hypothetical protein